MAYIDFGKPLVKESKPTKHNCDYCIHKCNINDTLFTCSLSGDFHISDETFNERCSDKNIESKDRKVIIAIAYTNKIGIYEWIGLLSYFNVEAGKSDKKIIDMWYKEAQPNLLEHQPILKKIEMTPIIIAESTDNTHFDRVGHFLDDILVKNIIEQANNEFLKSKK